MTTQSIPIEHMCGGAGIWASGPLLGIREDMDDIINAIMKVHENSDQLKLI